MENFIKSITTGSSANTKDSLVKKVLFKALFYLGMTIATFTLIAVMWFCYIVFASMV